ncbi:two-component response regulator ARR14-like protein [Cinnamomum micranthum f. kanehirae]|uniref:Two-component response regulator ARR14-like protein n=1 Tax=Cinnamomum micranthum f. kanehirae TaxID=337451 RepID=A0A3S3NDR6_9MAGN|nr:two-component response regulator ARR14-like protein [Cinnamomum micranthum f. kanehirae]
MEARGEGGGPFGMGEVTTCTHPAAALSILRERIGCYDVIIADVYKPNMKGFELLKIFCQEMHLPLFISNSFFSVMSANCDVDVAMRGLENEARYHLKKPVSVGELKNIWQPIIRKSIENENDIEEIGPFGEIRQTGCSSEENDNPDAAAGWVSSVDHVELERHKRKKGALGVRIDAKGKKVNTAERKERIRWDAVLHNNFVKSIDQIGIDSTVPKKIVQSIDASGLNLKNVASHLQVSPFQVKAQDVSSAANGWRPGPNKHSKLPITLQSNGSTTNSSE